VRRGTALGWRQRAAGAEPSPSAPGASLPLSPAVPGHGLPQREPRWAPHPCVWMAQDKL